MNELSEFYPYLEMPGVVENAHKVKDHLKAREARSNVQVAAY